MVRNMVQKPTLSFANQSVLVALLCTGMAFVFCAGIPVGCDSPRQAGSANIQGAAGLQESNVPDEIVGRTMGTTYMVKCFPGPEVDLEKLSQAIEDELQSVNQQMSTYIDSSELSLFNDSQDLGWQAVSSELAFVAALATEISTKSDGAFDVTVGPLVDLWGFGSPAGSEGAPTKEEVQEALASVGFSKTDVRTNPPELRKEVPALRVDLSAIAKGHGVDRVCDVLEEQGVDSYFVEIGGEVRAMGRKPGGDPWVVGIESPDPKVREILFALELDDLALATSGDYRNFRTVDGQTVSHTIDPRTGFPVLDPITSASAFAKTCAEADGIATAMMSAGYVDGLQLAERNRWAVILIARNEESDGIRLEASTEFRKLFPAENVSLETGVQP